MPELLVLAGIVVLSVLCCKFLMDIENLFYELVVIRVKKNT